MLHYFIEACRSKARKLSEWMFDGKYINILTVIKIITEIMYLMVSAPVWILVGVAGFMYALWARLFPATGVDNDEKSDDFEFSDYDK